MLWFNSHVKKQNQEKKKNMCIEEKKNSVRKKKQQKSANSFCKKNFSFLHLEIRAVLGDRTVAFCFICPFLAPWQVLQKPQTSVRGKQHSGMVASHGYLLWCVLMVGGWDLRWLSLSSIISKIILMWVIGHTDAAKGGSVFGVLTPDEHGLLCQNPWDVRSPDWPCFCRHMDRAFEWLLLLLLVELQGPWDRECT